MDNTKLNKAINDYEMGSLSQDGLVIHFKAWNLKNRPQIVLTNNGKIRYVCNGKKYVHLARKFNLK